MLPRLATLSQYVNRQPSGNLAHLQQVAQAAADQHGINTGLVGAIVVIVVVIVAIAAANEDRAQVVVVRNRGDVGLGSLVAAVVVVAALLLFGFAVVSVWNK